MHEENDWSEMFGVEEPPFPGGAVWQPPPRLGLITPHFSWNEAACNHCGLIPNPDVIIETAEWMERVRTALGGRILHVNSWSRCPAWNAQVGGAPNSFHVRGMAVDFVARGLTPVQTHSLCRKHQGAGKLIGGLGKYPSFTHCDWGPPRRWNGP